MSITVAELLDLYFWLFGSMVVFMVLFVILRLWFLLNRELKQGLLN